MRLWVLTSVGIVLSGCSFMGNNYGQNGPETFHANQGARCYAYTGAINPVSYGSCNTAPSPALPHINCDGQLNVGIPCGPVTVNTQRIGTFPTHAYSHGIPAPSPFIDHSGPHNGLVHRVDHGQGDLRHINVPQLRRRKPQFIDQSYFYGTLGLTSYDLRNDVYGAEARLGYQSGKIIGAEIEGSLGITSSDENIEDASVSPAVTFPGKTGVDYSTAVFATARIPITEELSLHARGGYHATRTTGTFTDNRSTPPVTTNQNLSVDGLAYGVGAEFAFDAKNALRLDLTRYEAGSQGGDRGSIAYVRRF